MANTYQWAVNSMTAYPEADGRQDVVFQVAWVCSGTNGTYSASDYGVVNVTLDPAEPFIPYPDLTLDEVLGWVFGVLGPDGISAAEANVDAKIASQENPVSVTPPLPWN